MDTELPYVEIWWYEEFFSWGRFCLRLWKVFQAVLKSHMSAVRFHPSSSQGILFPVQLGTSASAYLCILAPSCPLSIISLVARRNTAIVHPKNSFWLSWRICVILNHFDYFSLKWSVSMEDSDCWWACCWLNLTESMLSPWFSGSRGDHFKQVPIYLFIYLQAKHIYVK